MTLRKYVLDHLSFLFVLGCMARERTRYHGILSAILLLSTTYIVSCHSINDLSSQKSVAVVGQTIQLSCVTDFPSNCVKWTFKRVETTKEINVYSKEIGINPNYTRINVTTHDPGGCTLKINDIQLDDAGNYECSVFATNKTILRITNSNLTVINQTLDCSENFDGKVNEDQEIELTCTVSFKGDWIPETQWKRITKQGFEEYISEDQQTIASTCRLTPTGLKTALNFKANYTLDGSSFTHRLLLVPNFADKTVNDFDKVKQIWNSSTLNVLYGVKSIQVCRIDNGKRNNAQMFCVGEKLECAADANPSPSYEWTDDRGTLRVTGESLDLLPNMTNLTLMCTAKNSVSERRSYSFRVNESCAYGRSHIGNRTAIVVIIIVLGVAALLVVITIVTFCSKRGAFQGSSCCRRPVEKSCNQLEGNADAHPTGSRAAAVGNSHVLSGRPTEPVYAQVQTKAVPIHSRKKFYVAADGTEYMDINYSPAVNQSDATSGKQHVPPPKLNQTRGNMARQVHENATYAAIDHTLKAPL